MLAALSLVLAQRRPQPSRGAPAEGTRATATGWKLFNLVQHAIDGRVDGLAVEYRPNGLLKRLSVDQWSGAADDEYEYVLDRYRRLR
jgi:hypothetical protein